jgi:hypothetical protein
VTPEPIADTALVLGIPDGSVSPMRLRVVSPVGIEHAAYVLTMRYRDAGGYHAKCRASRWD